MDPNKIATVGQEMIELLTVREVSANDALLMLCSLAITMPTSGKSVSRAEGIARAREAIDFLESLHRTAEAARINN